MSRIPFRVEGYCIGDEGKPEHFDPGMTKKDAAAAAESLAVHDAAFIRRSDMKWTYAIVSERIEEGGKVILRFDVDKEKNRKSFPQQQWGKYIRVIKPEARTHIAEQPDTAALDGPDPSSLPVGFETVAENTIPQNLTDTLLAGDTNAKETPKVSNLTMCSPTQSKQSSGILSYLFGGKDAPSTDGTQPGACLSDVLSAAETEPGQSAITSAASVAGGPTRAPAADDLTTKSAPVLRKVPSSILRSVLRKNKGGDTQVKANEESVKEPVRESLKEFVKESAIETKAELPPSPNTTLTEWKGTIECDYDMNPTAMFQALEARQFDYITDMFASDISTAMRECKTWVVSRNPEDLKDIRFRALPLHGAVFFKAPDEVALRIIDAFPDAVRGRDAKGRLPIHLAFEHEASDRLVSTLLEIFPKGFFAKDKSDKLCSDYVKPDSNFAYRVKFVSKLLEFYVGDEKNKWEEEKKTMLAKQREDLKKDEDFLSEIGGGKEKDIRAEHAKQIVMLQEQHEKDILYLKKKHADETQALLEGFEVKLNFEKKLRALQN